MAWWQSPPINTFSQTRDPREIDTQRHY
jgi:hypothetical protein